VVRPKTSAKGPKFGLPKRRITAAVLPDYLPTAALDALIVKIGKLEKRVQHEVEGVVISLDQRVAVLDNHLQAALERKPNKGLQYLADSVKQCSYQLKAQRTELDQLVLQLATSTKSVEALCRQLGGVPTLQPMSAAEVEALVDKRLEAMRLRELQQQG
jgi:hypothetical protein